MDSKKTKMYEKHHNEIVITWAFYEFTEKPVLVLIQNVIFNFFIPFKLLYRQYLKHSGRTSNFPSKDQKKGKLGGNKVS